MIRRLLLALVIVAGILAAPFAYLYANTFSNGWIGVSADYESGEMFKNPPGALIKPVRLRVATFNIQDLLLVAKDHEPRMIAIARKLGVLDPDIVGFQEAFIEKHRELLASELQKYTRLRHFQYFPSAKAGSGLFIASAHPIREAWFHRFTVSNPWWKIWEGDYWAGKGAGLARIELPDGAGFLDFFNTHAQASYGIEANRAICAQQMGEYGAFIRDARIASIPTLAVGDLNCRIGSEGFTNLVTTANLVRAMNMDSFIDHVLNVDDPAYTIEVRETVEISEHVVSDGREFDLSDHNGYMSELLISPVAANKKAESTPAPERPNVLLIVVDTLRADRIAAERNGIPVMPFLREFASGGAWFTRAESPATWTKPAVTSILTGLYPETHGVQFGVKKAWFEGQDMSVMQKLPAGTPTLSTMLDQLGYRSGTIQTNQHVTQASGYGEGVDYFEFLFAQPAGLITTKALDFIRDGDGPWFLYAHYIDPHAGYDPPEPHRSAFGPLPEMTPEEVEWLDDNNYHTGYYMDRFKYDVEFIQERQYGEFSDSAKEAIRQLYDGECRYTDAELKRLIEAVQAEYPQTLIVITSDHGEEFWEHGSIGHAKTVYEELSNVPLIVVGPGVAPTVVESPVSTLDITPTVARYLGTEFNPLAQGSDLLTPRSATAPAYTSTKGSIPEFKLDAASVVEWPFKLVEDRKRGWTRLFDLVADPGEKTDISESNPDMKSKLETALAAHKTSVEKGTAVETTAVSEEEMKALESLGYVGNSQAPENNGKDCEGEGEGTCEGETP